MANSSVRSFFAPGRVNLIGEHTDYSGGLVLPAAIDRGVQLDVHPRQDDGSGRIRLKSLNFHGEVDVAADGSEMPADGWGRYVAAVAFELASLGRPSVGMRGRLSSDLPAGSGLSSSAALEVALGTALCAVAEFSIAPMALAGAMQRAELRGVGVPCGIMDQAASILGLAHHAVLLDCDTLEHRLVPLPESLSLVIIDSGVRRSLDEGGYATRRTELEGALVVLEGANPSSVTWKDVDASALDDVSMRRLRHVVTENQRVRDSVDAMAGGDIALLGRLFTASHASLRDDFEVSVPEVDRLVELTVRAGAVAARMTGAGFGGAIVALVPTDKAATVADTAATAYTKDFPHHTPTIVLPTASNGAAER